MNIREQIMKDPKALVLLTDALSKGVLIEGFKLVDDNVIVVDSLPDFVIPESYAYHAREVMEMKSIVDDITRASMNFGARTKKIDVYRRYEPNPDAQPRNERCKCGSGKKHKHCCIKK